MPEAGGQSGGDGLRGDRPLRERRQVHHHARDGDVQADGAEDPRGEVHPLGGGAVLRSGQTDLLHPGARVLCPRGRGEAKRDGVQADGGGVQVLRDAHQQLRTIHAHRGSHRSVASLLRAGLQDRCFLGVDRTTLCACR